MPSGVATVYVEFMRVIAGALVAVALGMTSTGCGSACSADARVGLSVTVVDASTKQAICDAQVTATRSGSAAQNVPANPVAPCRYDVFESAGTWAVAASAPAHAAASKDGIVVPGDGCHAVATPVTLELAPQ